MRLARLALGAALLLGTVPLAAASHARCAPQFAAVCSTAARTCRAIEDFGVVDPHCPVY